MAPDPNSNIHDDAYQTDSYLRSGPLGIDPTTSSTFHVADCGSVAFDAKKRIITVCVGLEGPRLLLLDPVTLSTQAALTLPPRSGGGTGTSPFNDFSGGGYFYLDNENRAVIPTNTRQIWVIGVNEGTYGEGPSFEIETIYDLSRDILPGQAIVSVFPDWDGRLWFGTTKGLVGTVDPKSQAVHALQLDGEVIANSFAADETGGLYIVTDHALYRFDANPDGEPKVTWRAEYDRGSQTKPGQASQGSGTTPTLIGRDYVAITDNAEPQMNVIVYRRSPEATDRLVCSEPVFKSGEGATDNSLIAVGNSIVVENNYGYSGPTATMDGKSTTPGITRVDFSPSGCRTAWESNVTSPSVVAKASAGNGLVYVYEKEPRPDDQIDAWYLTALDFRTGRKVFSKLAGTGLGFNNNYAPITIGPDGSAYIGALGGLIRIADKTTQP
jgi:hypothetical protein